MSNSINSSELRFSPLIVGCWQLDHRIWRPLSIDHLERAVDTYLALGVDTFDTADTYGQSEELLGRLLKGRDCKILTKISFFTHSPTPTQVRHKIEHSLRSLKRDSLDGVQVHWQDPVLDYGSTFATLRELQDQGKIQHIGVTNFTADMVTQALRYAPLRIHQIQYSLIDRRVEYLMQRLCAQQGLDLLPYGAIAGGYLSERFLMVQNPRGESNHARGFFYSMMIQAHGGWLAVTKMLDVLGLLAEKYNKTVAQVALNWVKHQSGVSSVITGLTLDRQRIQENVMAVQWQMDPEDLELLTETSNQLFTQEGDVYSYERHRY